MADNEDLKFSVSIDDKELLKQLDELSKRAKNALEFSVDNKDLKENRKELRKTVDEVTTIQNKLKEVSSTRVESASAKNLRAEIERVNKELEKTDDRIKSLAEKGYAPDSARMVAAIQARSSQRQALGRYKGSLTALEKRGKDTIAYTETEEYQKQIALLKEKQAILRGNLIPIEKAKAVQEGITTESNRQSLAEQENAAQVQKLRDDLEKVEDEWRKVRAQAEAIRNREFGAVRDDDIPRGANTKYDSLRDKMISLVSTMSELEGKIYELEYGVKESGNSFVDSGNKVSSYADRLKEADTAVKGIFDGVELDLDDVKEHVNGVKAAARALYELRNSGKELSGIEVIDIMEAWSKSAQKASADWDALRDVLAGFSEGARKSAEYLKPDTLDMYKTVIRGVANQLNIAGEAVEYLTRATQVSSFSDEEKARALAQLTEWATNCKNAIEALYQAQGEQGVTEKRAQEIADLEAQLAKLNSQIEVFNGEPISIEMPDVAKVENTLLGMIVRLRELKREQAELEKVSSPTLAQAQQYEKNRIEIEELTLAIKQWGKEMESVSNKQEKTAKSSSKLSAILKKMSISSFGLKDAFKHIGHYMKSAEKAHNQFSRSLKHGLTNLTKYVFGFRSLFFLIRRLRSVVKEGVQNLVQYDSANNETNHKMTELMTSLLFLKNAWGAAFAPILNVVLPILSALLNMIAAVGNAIAMFFGSLFGQTEVIQAVRVETQDYADTLKNVGGGASKASKAADKLHDRLAAFDDLNVLGKDKDTDPSSSGGGGGAGNQLVPNINDMFKKELAKNSFADMIKTAWDTGDFKEVGAFLANGIKTSLDNIPWDEIQAYASKIGFGAGTFLTGLFGDPEAWKSIGSTFAEGLNTASEAIHGFFEGYEGGFGSGVITAINEFFVDTDWKLVGENVGDAIATIAQEFADFLNGVDFNLLADSWDEFASGVKGTELLNAINNLNIAFGGLVYRLGNDGLSGWMWKNKVAVAMLSPQLHLLGEVIQYGGEIVDSVKDKFLKFGAVLRAHNITLGDVCDVAVGVYEEIMKVVFLPLLSWWDLLKANFELFVWAIKSNLDMIKADVESQITGIKFVIATNVAVIKQTCLGLFGLILNNFDAVESGFESMGDGISAVWDWLSDIFVSGANSCLSTMESWANNMINAINSILDVFSNFGVSINDDLANLLVTLNPALSIAAGTLNFQISGGRASNISIPRLAQGAVIPANHEFAAILGDQTHGTNIEAPLDTIKQAVAEELNIQISQMMSGFQSVVDAIERKNLNVNIGDKEIGQANARYTNRQNIIRGVRGVV